jgi:hypothetical protein
MDKKYSFCEPPRTIQINAAQRISTGMILVVGASLSAGAAAGAAVLYDGVDLSADPLLTLTAIIGDTVGQSWPRGILFERGLYCTVSAVTLFLTLSYYTIEEGIQKSSENGSD